MRKNLYFLLMSQIIIAFSAGWAVIKILFLRELGLNFFEITILLAIGSFSVILFEIPTGIFADLYGRKKSIASAFGLNIIAAIFLLTGKTIYTLIPAFIALGAAYSLWSGTFQAFLFETLDNLNIKDKYIKYLSKLNFTFVFVTAASTYIVPLLYSLNKMFPFILTILLNLIMLLLVYLLKETSYKRLKKINKKVILNQIFTVIIFLRNNNSIMFLILFGAFFGTSISLFGELFNQPLISKNYSLKEYGQIFAITTIIQSLILFKIDEIILYLKRSNVYVWLIIIWMISVFAAMYLIEFKLILILLMAIIWSVGSANYIVLSNEFNSIVTKNKTRATVLSVASMINAIIFMIAILFFGKITDLVGVENSCTISIVIFSVVSSLILFLSNLQQRSTAN